MVPDCNGDREMTQSSGCFDRHDDEPDVNEYASPPCYMHEVDPSYFGLLPSTKPIPGRKPNGAEIIANVPLRTDAAGDKIAAHARLPTLFSKLSQTIGRHAATLIERMEAHCKVRALARLRARDGSRR